MTLTDDTLARLTGYPLVEEDLDRHRFRVHRSTMTSTRIFEAERQRVFNQSWLYMGHESEVREPGDYVRQAGGRPADVHGARREVGRRCGSFTTRAPTAAR